MVTNAPPPLTWLRAFEAAARHLSFTRAGDELGLTQSAISQHVRALEAHLGQALFHRAHRSLRLSDAGRLLLPDVTAGLALLGHATQRFRADTPADRLRIAASASIARHLLAPRIAQFQGLCPGLVIEIQTTIWPDDFMATAADVEIRFGRADMVGKDATRLVPCQLLAVATPALAPAANAALVSGVRPQASLIQPVGLSTQWGDLLPGAHGDIVVDTHGMAVDLALEGAGVALTHCQIAQPCVDAGALCALDLPVIDAAEGYFIALRRDAPPQAARFSDWFLGEIQSRWPR